MTPIEDLSGHEAAMTPLDYMQTLVTPSLMGTLVSTAFLGSIRHALHQRCGWPLDVRDFCSSAPAINGAFAEIMAEDPPSLLFALWDDPVIEVVAGSAATVALDLLSAYSAMGLIDLCSPLTTNGDEMHMAFWSPLLVGMIRREFPKDADLRLMFTARVTPGEDGDEKHKVCCRMMVSNDLAAILDEPEWKKTFDHCLHRWLAAVCNLPIGLYGIDDAQEEPGTTLPEEDGEYDDEDYDGPPPVDEVFKAPTFKPTWH